MFKPFIRRMQAIYEAFIHVGRHVYRRVYRHVYRHARPRYYIQTMVLCINHGIIYRPWCYIQTMILYIGTLGHGETMPGDFHKARFKRLGYMSLDSNERSNFQASYFVYLFFRHHMLVHISYYFQASYVCAYQSLFAGIICLCISVNKLYITYIYMRYI